MPNNRIHSDKIKLRRFALQLYFAGDAGRYKSKKMKNCIYILLLTIFLSGCGFSVKKVDECIPKSSFISTKEIQFVSYRPKEGFMNEAYDPLNIGNSEDWYLKLVDVVNPLITILPDDPYVEQEYPEGTELELTGKAKIHDAWGLMTAFNSDIVYLHGTIDNTVIWAPAFWFDQIKKSKNNKNEFNFRNSGLDKFTHRVSCKWNDL